MHGTGTVTESQLFQQTKTRLLQGWTQQFYARDHDGLKVPPPPPARPRPFPGAFAAP